MTLFISSIVARVHLGINLYARDYRNDDARNQIARALE